jgi:hypothetical protein
VDAVARNVTAEAKRGHAQQRAVVRERRHAEREDHDDEIGIENAVSSDRAIVSSSWLTELSVIWILIKFRLL